MSDFMFHISDFVFHSSDLIVNISDFGFHISDFRCHISDFWFHLSDFIFHNSGFIFHISCFEFHNSYFRIRIPHFIIHISYFMFPGAGVYELCVCATATRKHNLTQLVLFRQQLPKCFPVVCHGWSLLFNRAEPRFEPQKMELCAVPGAMTQMCAPTCAYADVCVCVCVCACVCVCVVVCARVRRAKPEPHSSILQAKLCLTCYSGPSICHAGFCNEPLKRITIFRRSIEYVIELQNAAAGLMCWRRCFKSFHNTPKHT